MTIYTDGVHLITDDPASYDALHEFASKIGLRRRWFQGDHYDITTRKKAEEAVAAGAVLIGMRMLGMMTIKLRGIRQGWEGTLAQRLGLDPEWTPPALDPSLAADKNTELMRRFAPGRRVGRRGVDHL